MDSIGNILNSQDHEVPETVQKIKIFVKNNFNTDIKVTIRSNSIELSATSASLINALRFKIGDLQKLIDPPKKIMFRIQP